MRGSKLECEYVEIMVVDFDFVCEIVVLYGYRHIALKFVFMIDMIDV